MRPALQLYSVTDELTADFEGTLRRVAEIGYSQVEVADLLGKTGSEFRNALKEAGLECPSMHRAMPELLTNLDQTIWTAIELGVQFVVCSVPWPRNPESIKADPSAGLMDYFIAAIRALSADDIRWNAEQLNRIGEKLKRSDLQLAYHNHNFEFRRFDDIPGYDDLLLLTEPDLVAMELDCAWVKVAGADPLKYLRKYYGRFRLLHIRDFEPGFTPTTDLAMTAADLLGPAVPAVLGTGIMSYGELLTAARAAGIEYYFVERDPFFKRVPMLDALRADYQFLADRL
jgi:sugar phosphate isomerase/epimerase